MQGAARGRGRRGVHDRRQPPRVRARGHCSPPGRDARARARPAPYDHCNFTVLDGAPPALVERFRELLLAMSYDDPEVRPLLDMEGLKAVAARADQRATRCSSARSIASAPSTAGSRRSRASARRAHRRRDGRPRRSRARRRRAPARQARAARRRAGERVVVRGTAPDARASTCRAWCRAQGHGFADGRRARSAPRSRRCAVPRGCGRWRGAERAGAASPRPRGRRAPLAALGPRGARRARRGRRPRLRLPLCARKRRRLGRRGGAALRAGRRRAVGSGDRDPVGRAGRPSRRGRGRGRPGHDVPDRERDRGAARAGALPRRSCIRTSAR